LEYLLADPIDGLKAFSRIGRRRWHFAALRSGVSRIKARHVNKSESREGGQPKVAAAVSGIR
jgi:hypothetical protein